MFRNYLKVTFRHLIRHKAFSLINIAGLAIGMACSIFILLWVQNELSYDRFHANLDKIYRITGSAGDFKAAVNAAAMPSEIQKRIPGIERTVRLSHPSTGVFEYGANKFEEKNYFYADSTFLRVFSFPLLKGDPNTALNRPDAVLITARTAQKYFGNSDPVGKILRQDNQQNIIVTGVLANIPSNSHLQFDIIRPMSALYNVNYDLKNNVWTNFNFYSYIQLNEKADDSKLKEMVARMNTIFKEHVQENKMKISFDLQPLKDIHLRSAYQVDLPGHGDIQYVNIFFVIAIFILVVACINYMNLATARSARRAKEVGLRKVVGAARGQLVGQFLGESIITSFVALLIAGAAVWLLLPAFNHIAGKEIVVRPNSGFVAAVAGMALLTGIVSGSYPALFLSRFRPVNVLKGHIKAIGGNIFFRNGLVVTQFVVSIILLAGTAVVYQQLHFIRTMNLGFDKSNLVYMSMRGEMWQKQDALRTELSRNPLTSDFTIVDDIPVHLTSGVINVKWDGKDPNSQIVFPTLFVSESFFDVFRMQMLNGRGFQNDFKSDTNNLVINETAAKVMGFTAATAVGKTVSFWDVPGTVIGVVKDFNFKPIQQPIEPMVLKLNRWGGEVVIRTKPGTTEETLAAMEKISTKLNPAYPFSYNFIDQNIANLYQGEQQMGSLFNVFSILAIFISCLGLYGLSAFMAEQRTKEIGVRKVLGASVFNVVYLLSRGFTRLILLAVIIAVPVAWFAINSWLESFAYRIQVSWIIFAGASIAALAIAWLTVSYESMKAAAMNPVRSLRTE